MKEMQNFIVDIHLNQVHMFSHVIVKINNF